jgi:hypothetical protein
MFGDRRTALLEIGGEGPSIRRTGPQAIENCPARRIGNRPIDTGFGGCLSHLNMFPFGYMVWCAPAVVKSGPLVSR